MVSWGQAIKGKVIDAQTKETIPGANIAVPGVKGVGTSTNFDGEFTFTLPAGKTQIQVSFVGYKTKVVNVQPGATVTVSLSQDAEMLDDVVVVGYGVQKKESISSSVATVDVKKAVDSRPVPDLGRALQGSTPGLSVRVANGELGADPTYRIRGSYTSLNGSSDPLILVDNVPISTLTLLNPDDVESISVLKDASSAAIYGAKAANGVILIKTKDGKDMQQGTFRVNYSGSIAFRMATKMPKLAGIEAYQYKYNDSDMWRTASQPDMNNVFSNAGYGFYMNTSLLDRAKYWQDTYGGMSTLEPMVYGRDWEKLRVNGASTAYNYGYRTYDVYESLYKDWTPWTNHNVSISGNTGKTSFNIGLGYLQQVGFLDVSVDNYVRYNASVSVRSEITNFFTARAALRFSKSEKKYPNNQDGATYDALWYALRWSQYMPQGTTWYGYPVRDSRSEIEQSGVLTDTKQNVSVNVGGTLKILKGWTADIDVTYVLDNRFEYYPGYWRSYVDTWSAAPIAVKDDEGNFIYRDRDGNIVPQGTEGATQEYGWTYRTTTTKGSGSDRVSETSKHSDRIELNATTSYTNRFGDHDFRILAGISTSSYRYFSNGSVRYGLIYVDRPYFNLATGNQTVSGSRTWQSQVNYFGRLNYSWKNKLSAELSFAYNGTSKYPTDMRWKFFPSGSVAYTMSEENFMQSIRDVVSFVKFRASYGSLGNQTLGANVYIPTLSKSTSTWGDYNGSQNLQQFSSPTLIREDVTWEKISTLSFGVDMRFWRNKLGVSFEWFNRKTTDMFVPDEVKPSTYGGTAPSGNFGSMRTNGAELTIDFNHTFKNGLNLAVAAGVSDAKTTILKYRDQPTHSFGTPWSQSYYDGKVMGEIWGYHYDRLYQVNDFEEIALSGKSIPDNTRACWYYGKAYALKPGYTYNTFMTPRPGTIKYKDLDGDGAITSGNSTIEDPGDRTRIGNTTPRWEYNFSIDLAWKGFDFRVFFQGVGKRDAWSRGPLVSPAPELGNGASASILTNMWSPEKPNNYWPIVQTMTREEYVKGNWQINDHYLLNMAYLRCKTLTLGYTIPERLTKKISINKLRAYFTVENLFTIDNLKVDIDPEINTGNMSVGADYAIGQLGVTTPLPKYYTLGLQLTL